VFSACGCVSTHVVWSEKQFTWFKGEDHTNSDATPYLLKSLANEPMPSGQRLYFDYGSKGLDFFYEMPTKTVIEWLEGQGYEQGKSIKIKKFEGADHNETAWRARVGEQLEWMLGEG